jgi:FAD synthase
VIGGLPSIGPAAVVMGVFDGVHRGHQSMVRAVRAAAR